MTERGAPPPHRLSLGDLTEAASRGRGVWLTELAPLSTLLVHTDHTLYRITVPVPEDPSVLVQGGRFFPATTKACLTGSSLGGSCVKRAWVGIGLCLEFRLDDAWIITSPVRSITLEPGAAVPGPF